MKLVSIIVPNYNHAPFLQARIDSILNQSYDNFELIILDDKSQDGSEEIIEAYRGHPKITQIVYNEENSGSTFHQWNKGVSLASGKYIWLAESDDMANPNLLSTLVANIEKEENIVISYCQSVEIDSKGNKGRDMIIVSDDFDNGDIYYSDFIMSGEDYIAQFLLDRNMIVNASGALFRKEIYEKIGGATTDVGYTGDWLVWLKMLTQGNVAYSCLRYNYFRRHENSVVVSIQESENRRFIKKVDLLTRFASLNYFKKNFNKKRILDKCFEYIVRDSIVEAKFLWNRKEYVKALKYLFYTLRYSKNKKETFKQAIAYIRNKI